MDRFVVAVSLTFLVLISGGAVGKLDQLALFAMQRPVFVWDSGIEPGAADSEDIFLLWCVDCLPSSLAVSYEEAVRLKAFRLEVELDHIQEVLSTAKLGQSDFNGSILRGRKGAEGSPLFLLFPTPHSGSFLAGGRPYTDASTSLHTSNALDFLNIVDRAGRRLQTVTSVSESNYLVSGEALRKLQLQFSDRNRDDYVSDQQWILDVMDEGVLDASQFLLVMREDDSTLKHAAIEPMESYLESVILNIALANRYWNGLSADTSLYESFPEYVLGLKYRGSILHRFPGNSELQEALRARWETYRKFSQLTELQLEREVENLCRRRSEDMVRTLKFLMNSDRSDYYLVTFGPMHLHGLLLGLEKYEMSYLVVVP